MLYEFGFQLHFSDVFKLLAFILPICLYLISCCLNNKIAKYIILVFSILFVLLMLFVLIISPLYSYYQIKHYIEEDNLITIEGIVSQFESPENSTGGHNNESFAISGVEFTYYGNENYGYSTFLCDGGVIKGNGQKLKISYCYDPITKEKVICFIQQVK